MGQSMSYPAIAAAVATLIVIVVSVASKANKKKAEAVAATGLSQTGREGGATTAAATAADVAQPTPASNDAFQKQMEAIMAEEDELFAKDIEREARNKRWPPDQCGLEDDGEEWEEWEGPQRIKECQLSAADQERCRKILALCFNDDAIIGRKVLFDPDDVIEISDMVITYLESEPVLIEDLPLGISIVGDLHGQLHDLDRVFEGAEVDGKPGWECAKFLFLGDFVDRGRQSLEITMALFCLKMLYPDRIFILRGNHEYTDINKDYGFRDDLRSRYLPRTATVLFIKINSVFCFLSIAAIVGNKFLCVHGGISMYGFTRRHMRGIYKPIIQSTDEAVIHDMNWSDPATGLRGTCFNNNRKTSMYFGYNALCYALDSMEVSVLIRGHQMMMEGFSVKWFVCHTVFTASGYGTKNDGAICEIDEDGKVGYRIIPYDPIRAQWEKEIEKLEGLSDKDPNETTLKKKYDDAGDGHVADMTK